ncbi:hypothetical protein J6590_028927, partial [Homalodisca vitripennis]
TMAPLPSKSCGSQSQKARKQEQEYTQETPHNGGLPTITSPGHGSPCNWLD